MIKLNAISYNNQGPVAPLSAVFGRDGGTLGRGANNHFVLPDPKNLVSRVQASITSDGAHHVITNLSQASPILLNGNEIEFNREYTFNAGDEIQIGLYILRAEPHLVAIEGSAGLVPENAPSPSDHEAEEKPRTFPELALNPSSSFATKRATPNLAELHQQKSDAGAARAKSSDEPEPATSVESAEPAVDESIDAADQLMQAFLKGAGIPHVNLNAGVTPEFMETLGNLLATSVKGTFHLLATRASVKREVRADLTIVVVRNNNPLKFLSDSETVLMQMLRKKMPGFMGPGEAMQDAFDDLQAHQTGMIAGMNGAISEVLKRFDPKALVKRMKESSLLDKLMPVRRKAQLWDKYDAMFDEINREAQHDYQKLFGKAFLKAYEKEIARSRGEKQDG